jgi:hypothetical protein
MERELKDFKGANNAHEERMCLIKRVMRDDNIIQYEINPGFETGPNGHRTLVCTPKLDKYLKMP